MANVEKNSLDLLRLLAATLVLYSHQYALMGMPEPSFFGWTTFGGAGVTIFFFLSGMLVWSSWDRDPHVWRFFVRRSLRIFPALWLFMVCTVFLLGPTLTSFSLRDYFVAPETWRYLSGTFLLIRNNLPGVFLDNPYPQAVNGSLWTLPVEFLCYIAVAVVGFVAIAAEQTRSLLIAIGLLFTVLLASFAPVISGMRFAPHFEMIAVFWWGVFYGCHTNTFLTVMPVRKLTLALVVAAFLVFSFFGPRSLERMAMLVCAALLVYLALKIRIGAKVTDPLGDLSYGVYILAFPVQQMLVQWGRNRDRDRSFAALFALSLALTGGLAFASWHLVEKMALRFKPRAGLAK